MPFVQRIIQRTEDIHGGMESWGLCFYFNDKREMSLLQEVLRELVLLLLFTFIALAVDCIKMGFLWFRGVLVRVVLDGGGR